MYDFYVVKKKKKKKKNEKTSPDLGFAFCFQPLLPDEFLFFKSSFSQRSLK